MSNDNGVFVLTSLVREFMEKKHGDLASGINIATVSRVVSEFSLNPAIWVNLDAAFTIAYLRGVIEGAVPENATEIPMWVWGGEIKKEGRKRSEVAN